MPRRSFVSEYRNFVRMYVLPLMGVPKKNIEMNVLEQSARPVNGAIVFYDKESSLLYFASRTENVLFMNCKKEPTEDTLNLAENLCKAFFNVSEFQFAPPYKKKTEFYSEIHREKVYRMAVQRGICTWIVGAENEAVEKLLSALERWSVQTYEGKKVTFGFVIDPREPTVTDSAPREWLKFLDNDCSAVLTDCIHSVILLDKECRFVRFLSLTEAGSIPEHELSRRLPLRFSQCISRYVCGSAVGIFLLNSGDIVLSKDGHIRFVKRNLRWLNFSFDAFSAAVHSTGQDWDEELLEEIYATMLDVSFAHTGGILSIVREPDELRKHNSSILKPYDDLLKEPKPPKEKSKNNEEKQLKRELLKLLVGGKRFGEIDRKLRSELTAMDGACILNTMGDVVSFGAIIRNDAESSGGARGAASKTLSKYGLAVKISTDGYVELYIGGECVFAIK